MSPTPWPVFGSLPEDAELEKKWEAMVAKAFPRIMEDWIKQVREYSMYHGPFLPISCKRTGLYREHSSIAEI